ncbi:hypothetical protein ABZZ17_05525 [Streptomyces sp. NPDC006512]|uniref:DUF6907 domain-containing protein n=1 Tax=Streptomyces sp. NPDC006512 TaxID=3154307 RepID=UPI00339EFEF7
MSNTVPADLPRMFRPEPKLSAVPTQPTGRDREALETKAAQASVDAQFPLAAQLVAEPAPRSWSFVDRRTGFRHEVTCLPGCVVSHEREIALGVVAEDVWCMTAETDDVWLPVSTGGKPADEVRLLAASIRQDPFDTNLAKRVPHAAVEVMEDSFIEPLDPDGLATVILGLEAQLKQMRAVHAQLVELRAQNRVEL